jgi:hypothetical protein
MKIFDQVFGILLDSPQFSVAEQLAFGSDHEVRLAANNPDGIFDGLLAETATALDAVSGSTGREATAEAVQKARTKAKTNLRQEIQAAVSQQSGAVHARFGKDSPEYLEFFPRGLTELRLAREAEVPEILQRLVDAADANLPELKPVFTDLLTRWKAVSGEAAARRAARSASAEERNEALQALRAQLTKNLLTLALHFLGQPEKAKIYFNTSLLYNRQRTNGDETTGEGGLPEDPNPDSPEPLAGAPSA